MEDKTPVVSLPAGINTVSINALGDTLPEAISTWIEECSNDIANNNSTQIINTEDSRVKRFFSPFKLKSTPYVVSLTVRQTQGAVDQLCALADKQDISNNQLHAISTTLKNRAEIFSEKSDFYPAYSALIAIFLTYVALGISTPYKILMYLAGFIFILASFSIRVGTRREVSRLKCIANIIDNATKARA